MRETWRARVHDRVSGVTTLTFGSRVSCVHTVHVRGLPHGTPTVEVRVLYGVGGGHELVRAARSTGAAVNVFVNVSPREFKKRDPPGSALSVRSPMPGGVFAPPKQLETSWSQVKCHGASVATTASPITQNTAQQKRTRTHPSCTLPPPRTARKTLHPHDGSNARALREAGRMRR